MKRQIVVILSLLALCATGTATAQTAGVVNLSVSPASANGSAAPVLTWSTTPTAISCVASGGWSGTRAAAGSVTLSAITSTADFTLTCSWSGGLGSSLITWNAPTTNTDGSALTNLASFKIYYGTSQSALTQVQPVADPALRASTVTGLAPGPWYFAVRAVNASGTESSNSNVATKTITGPAAVTASKTVTLTINKIPSPPTDVTVIETTAYNIRPNYSRWAFERGSVYPGRVKLGAACEENKCVAGGYCVVSRRSMVTPAPAEGTYVLAKCG